MAENLEKGMVSEEAREASREAASGKPDEEKKIAVALRYDPDKEMAPLVLAAGKGTLAEEILRIAEENRIPLYEDRHLAELLSKLEFDAQIPPELFTLVAEVLFFVYQLDRMAEKREKILRKIQEESGQKIAFPKSPPRAPTRGT